MEDYQARFEAIMKDNNMGDWEPMSIEELAIIMSAISGAAMHISALVVEGLDSDDDSELPIQAVTIGLIRALYQAADLFLDSVIEDMFEENDEEEEEEEEDSDDE